MILGRTDVFNTSHLRRMQDHDGQIEMLRIMSFSMKDDRLFTFSHFIASN